MRFIDYLAITASLFTIVSICVNIIQWRSRKELVRALKSRSQAAYNYLYDVAHRSDEIRKLGRQSKRPADQLKHAINHAHTIEGIANAGRLDIISYSREHLNFIPIAEHPAHPLLNCLPKPGEDYSSKIVGKDYKAYGQPIGHNNV